MKMTDRSVADELEGEVEVEELGELGGEVHREALEPVVPGQLLLRLNQHRVRRVLNNNNKNTVRIIRIRTFISDHVYRIIE